MGYHIKELTYEQVQSIVTDNTVVVLPIGGGSKEHGYHLPMGTDYFITDWLAQQVTERCDVVTLPTLPYAYFPAFVEWKGSVSIEHDHFTNYVKDILLSFARHGVKKFLIIDGGVSTHPPLVLLSRDLNNHYGLKVGVTNIFGLMADAEKAVCQQKKGGHGDEGETSTMLVVRPDLVHMDKTVEEYTELFPGCKVNGQMKVDFPSPMLTPHGTNGNSTLATKEKGEVILNAMVDGICEFLEHFVPWDPKQDQRW